MFYRDDPFRVLKENPVTLRILLKAGVESRRFVGIRENPSPSLMRIAEMCRVIRESGGANGWHEGDGDETWKYQPRMPRVFTFRTGPVGIWKMYETDESIL